MEADKQFGVESTGLITAETIDFQFRSQCRLRDHQPASVSAGGHSWPRGAEQRSTAQTLNGDQCLEAILENQKTAKSVC